MRVLGGMLATILVAGCSIHPQTDDFSRDYVPDIVRKIKCEAHQAVVATASDADGKYLLDTGVAFAFDFIMDETNGAASEGTFGVPVPNGSLAFGWGIGETKNRKSQQRITIADAFSDLRALQNCSGALPAENFKYPITGEIGLLETFINYRNVMAEHAGNSLVGTFEDEITFKTDVSASVSARLKLVAVSTKSIDATGSTAVARSDLHRVKISFTPAENVAQRTARLKREQVKRVKELARLRAEKAIPLVVQLVGPDGKKIDPSKVPSGTEIQGMIGDTNGAAGTGEGQKKKKQKPPTRGDTNVPRTSRPSNYDIKEEALRQLERSDSRAFQDSFRRQYEDR